MNRAGQLVQRLIDREIERASVDDADLPVAHQLVDRPAAGLGVFARALFEYGDDARLAATRALDDELRGEDGLARSRRASDEDRVPRWNPATQHLVDALHADGETWPSSRRLDSRARRPRFLRADDKSREDLHAVVRNAKRVQAGDRRLAAQLHDLHLAHHRIAIDALIQPEEAVRHGEDGIVLAFRQLVLADEKRRRLPSRQAHGQLLYE